MKRKNGFSLIEVMISIAIIGVIGVISTAIFTQTLKTSSDTETISKLKQNGEQAMSLIENSIRNADAIICYGSTNGTVIDRIVVRTMDGKYTKFRFVDPSISAGIVTVNGYIARQDNLNPTLLSTFCTSSPDTANEVIITNNNPSSGVSISNGAFIKTASGNQNKDTVYVNFYVNQSKTAPGSSAQSAFMTTTIQVR